MARKNEYQSITFKKGIVDDNNIVGGMNMEKREAATSLNVHKAFGMKNPESDSAVAIGAQRWEPPKPR